jgi:hypothetical protein
VCVGDEKEKNACSPRRVGRWARAHDVCVNSLSKSGPKPRKSTVFFLTFIFATNSCLIRFDRERHNWLWDVVTLNRSSL